MEVIEITSSPPGSPILRPVPRKAAVDLTSLGYGDLVWTLDPRSPKDTVLVAGMVHQQGKIPAYPLATLPACGVLPNPSGSPIKWFNVYLDAPNGTEGTRFLINEQHLIPVNSKQELWPEGTVVVPSPYMTDGFSLYDMQQQIKAKGTLANYRYKFPLPAVEKRRIIRPENVAEPGVFIFGNLVPEVGVGSFDFAFPRLD